MRMRDSAHYEAVRLKNDTLYSANAEIKKLLIVFLLNKLAFYTHPVNHWHLYVDGQFYDFLFLLTIRSI